MALLLGGTTPPGMFVLSGREIHVEGGRESVAPELVYAELLGLDDPPPPAIEPTDRLDKTLEEVTIPPAMLALSGRDKHVDGGLESVPPELVYAVLLGLDEPPPTDRLMLFGREEVPKYDVNDALVGRLPSELAFDWRE